MFIELRSWHKDVNLIITTYFHSRLGALTHGDRQLTEITIIIRNCIIYNAIPTLKNSNNSILDEKRNLGNNKNYRYNIN